MFNVTAIPNYAPLVTTNITDVIRTVQMEDASPTLYDVIVPFLGCIIIVVNLIMALSVSRTLYQPKHHLVGHQCTYLFLGNIAIADAIAGVAVMFGQLYPTEKRSVTVCLIQLGMIVFSSITSIYTIGLIAIDRYMYICHGVQYEKLMNLTRAAVLICATWLVGVCAGFVSLLKSHNNAMTDGENCVKLCWFVLVATKNVVVAISITGAIPMVLIITLYLMSYHYIVEAKKHIKRRQTHIFHFIRTITISDIGNGFLSNNNKPFSQQGFSAGNSNVRSMAASLQTVGFLGGCFLANWVPYYATSILYVLHCDPMFYASTNDPSQMKQCTSLALILASPLAILALSNSLFNPYIYGWWHTSNQRAIRQGRLF